MKNFPNITMEAMEEEEKNSLLESKKNEKVNTFDAKNYLNTKLDIEKGEKSKELRVRILPIDDSSSTPFKKIFVHNVRVPKDVSANGWKSYICIEKTEGIDHEKYGHKCPFCELNREAFKKSKESNNPIDIERFKKTSLANIAKEACIIRVIDRGAEDDGPKFWKFNVKLDKSDPKNIIKMLYKSRLEEGREDGIEENILDIYNGKDLKITISQAETRGENDSIKNNKTSISIIDCGKNKPLSDNEDKIKKWVYDTKKWYDVFSIKPYDYLAIIINGGTPWFDRDNMRWVDKDEYNSLKDNNNKVFDDKINSIESSLKGGSMSVLDEITIDDDVPY